MTSNRTPINQQKDILPVNIDPFQLDFSQDWEKTSLASTSFNKKVILDHNYGISPQNMKWNHKTNFSDYNIEKTLILKHYFYINIIKIVIVKVNKLCKTQSQKLIHTSTITI